MPYPGTGKIIMAEALPIEPILVETNSNSDLTSCSASEPLLVRLSLTKVPRDQLVPA
jgi:hypothetical protein